MKIKLAILDRDAGYLNRIVSAFSVKYADKLQIYSFTDSELALSCLSGERIDVLLASDVFEIDAARIPKRCGFAYFAESVDVDSVNGKRAICKFQKAELIYKEILGIYSENAGRAIGRGYGDSSCKVIAFSSPCGGTGTSSVAAACAMRFAMQGKRTLYLNLERYGSADTFFTADGSGDMSDIIYALKSKKTNLAMKLESCVRRDECGVYFYAGTKLALDMIEMGLEEIEGLIGELTKIGAYDYIVVDMDFSLEEKYLKLYRKGTALVWVGDGSDISNEKLKRAYDALLIKERSCEMPAFEKLHLFYNKFSSKTGKALAETEMKNLGGAPIYIHAEVRQIVSQLAAVKTLDQIG